MAVASSEKVADAIIACCNKHGQIVTNLQLQKLLYYAQAWYLAIYGEELFPEEMEAWVHGPVEPGQYVRFKEHKFNPVNFEINNTELPYHVMAHIIEVLRVYGGKSALELEQQTHIEDPWLIARGDLPPDQPSHNVISKKIMHDYYKDRLDGDTE